MFILFIDKGSKLRSNAVTSQFLAYGFGSVILNIAAFGFKNVNYIMVSVLILCLLTVTPMVMLVLEGPSYLKKKG